jgi:hypothetical protein
MPYFYLYEYLSKLLFRIRCRIFVWMQLQWQASKCFFDIRGIRGLKRKLYINYNCNHSGMYLHVITRIRSNLFAEKYLRNAQDFVEILIDFLDHVEHFQIIVIPCMRESKHGQKIKNPENDQWYIHFWTLHINIATDRRAFSRWLIRNLNFTRT